MSTALKWWNLLPHYKRIQLRDKYGYKYLLQIEKDIELIFKKEML